jgi:hypothetical protein
MYVLSGAPDRRPSPEWKVSCVSQFITSELTGMGQVSLVGSEL